MSDNREETRENSDGDSVDNSSSTGSFLAKRDDLDISGNVDISYQVADKVYKGIGITKNNLNEMNRVRDALDYSWGRLVHNMWEHCRKDFRNRAAISSGHTEFKQVKKDCAWFQDMAEMYEYCGSAGFRRDMRSSSLVEAFRYVETLSDYLSRLETLKEDDQRLRLVIEEEYPDLEEVIEDAVSFIREEFGFDEEDST